MKLLITGGFGYLGGRLAQFLTSDSGDEIILGSRKQVEVPPSLSEAKVVRTRWDSLPSLEEICEGIDAIVHLAGMNAQDCMADPIAALEINAVATARLLQAAVRQGVKRFIYLSTSHVYCSPLTGIITEETCPVSTHPYATSHRAGEDVVRAAQESGMIEGIVIRLSNSFGAPLYKEANCWMLLVNDLSLQAVTTEKMVLRTSGRQRRDFITLTDTCRAIRHLLELPADNLGDGLYNVGGEWSPTVLEMTKIVAERIHKAMNIKPEITRKTDQNIESTELLRYETNKLISTGYNASGSSSIDQEIDALIRFCIKNFT